MGALFVIVLSLLAIFLILLILVQRGRGGGLAGALGGMGGSSAFGAKAGDVFTRITIYAATFWIAICLIATFWAKHGGDALTRGTQSSSSSASARCASRSAYSRIAWSGQCNRADGGSESAASQPRSAGRSNSAASRGTRRCNRGRRKRRIAVRQHADGRQHFSATRQQSVSRRQVHRVAGVHCLAH